MAFQGQTVEAVLTGQENTIIFCRHPEVITLGRKSEPGEAGDWPGEVVSVSRGGKATYHGPGQLVIYPIVNLTTQKNSRDVHAFLRALEATFVETLSHWGIEAVGKSAQKNASGNDEEATGVWVGGQKLVSVGIAVRRWVTYHGAAINLKKDKSSFKGFNPCGFQPNVMTSVEELVGEFNEEEFKARFSEKANSYWPS